MADLLKTLVVLGARGDMTGRLLLPALVRLAGERWAARRRWRSSPSTGTPGDDDAYRGHARAKLDAHLPTGDDKAADALLERLSYRRADVTSAEDLRAALDGGRRADGACTWRCRTCCSAPPSQALADAGLPAGHAPSSSRSPSAPTSPTPRPSTS